MAKQDFKEVFQVHPDAKEIYVVNGMPFLTKKLAQNFQRGTEHEIEVVKRPANNSKPKPSNKSKSAPKSTAKKGTAKKADAKKADDATEKVEEPAKDDISTSEVPSTSEEVMEEATKEPQANADQA